MSLTPQQASDMREDLKKVHWFEFFKTLKDEEDALSKGILFASLATPEAVHNVMVAKGNLQALTKIREMLEMFTSNADAPQELSGTETTPSAEEFKQ